MLKKSLIAVAALAMISVAVPAFATTWNSSSSTNDDVFGTSGNRQLIVAKEAVAQQLQQRGINVTNVDEWGGYVRADVTLPNGNQAVRFFEPQTLQPVSINDLR